MHDKKKDKKSFRELRKNLSKGPNQKSMAELFCKNSDFYVLTFFGKKTIINTRLCCLQRKKKQFLYYFIYFYVISYCFINCPIFADIKQT